MTRIKIVTDSASDLPRELLAANGIAMASLLTIMGDQVYEDRVNLDPPSFYQMLAGSSLMPKTAQVPPGAFQKRFEQACQDGSSVIAIIFSSGLSGTYQSAILAREALPGYDITVVDSRAASVGQGLIVLQAARMAAAGESKETILAAVHYMVQHMEHIFTVGSLEMLQRGGRVSSMQAFLGSILNIKVILQFEEGRIVPLDKVRGEKKALHYLLDTMEQRGSCLADQVVGICYSGDRDKAVELCQAIQERFHPKEIITSEIGSVIGSHVGAGTFAVFFLNDYSQRVYED